MQNDINSYGYNQWFFFEMRNTRKGSNVKFNILNYRKNDSLFNHGMKMVVYSVMENKKTGKGWFRDGKNFKYGLNKIVRVRRPNY